MPRFMAPPPSGEISITLTRGFSTQLGTVPREKIEIIGEPNRPANVKVTNHVGKDGQTITTKTGATQADDVNTLLALIKQLQGFPTNPTDDIYGFDTRMVLTTFEIQWDNGAELEGESAANPTEENKETFKEVMDSIMALVRQTAK